MREGKGLGQEGRDTVRRIVRRVVYVRTGIVGRVVLDASVCLVFRVVPVYLIPNQLPYGATPRVYHGHDVPLSDALPPGTTTRHVDLDLPPSDPRIITGLRNPPCPVRVRASNPLVRVQVSV